MSQTVKQILAENGLDFKVLKLDTQAILPNGEIIPSPYHNLYHDKTGEIINSVKAGYHITQNDEIVEQVLAGMSNYGEVSVHKAFSIMGGRRIALQLAIDGKATVNGDEIKRYVTVIDSNDGSTGLSVGIGDLTMSCQNQFFTFNRRGTIKGRHTSSIKQVVNNLSIKIGDALSDSLRLVDFYRNLESTKVSRNLADQMVKQVLGFNRLDDLSAKRQNSIDKMDSIYGNIDIEMNSKGDNLWGLHSGITRYTTHELSQVKAKQSKDRGNIQIERMMIDGGNAYVMNQKSLKLVTELAK